MTSLLAHAMERAPPRRGRVRLRALPGLPLTLGVTLTALCLIVLTPLAAVVAEAASETPAAFARAALSERALHAYALSLSAALAAALVNGFFGAVLAWALVRYRFPGRAVVNALVDLPLALPTAVAGVALASLYASSGRLGAPLALFGIKVAYTELGVGVALVFVGLPFVVRAIEPVLRDLARDMEEAAVTLGAGRWAILLKVIAPAVGPAWLIGTSLAFARAVGEYGSVIFIAGNLPYRTEIAPLLVAIDLEQFDYGAAAAVASMLLLASFALLLLVNGLGAWVRERGR
jgi:sulfate transport system permease protein